MVVHKLCKRKHALVVCNVHAATSPRILKLITELQKENFEVAVIGRGDRFDFPNIKFIPLSWDKKYPKLMRAHHLLGILLSIFVKIFPKTISNFKLYEFFWLIRKQVKKQKLDLLLIRDVDLIPLAPEFSTLPRIQIVVDFPEYALGQLLDSIYSRYIVYPWRLWCLSSINTSFVNSFLCVSDGIKRLYKENTGITCTVFRNVPPYQDLNPQQTRGDMVDLVHHGGAVKKRQIEEMISLLDYLPNNYRLTLQLLPTDKIYYNSLVDLASTKYKGRVFFKDTVDTYDIAKSINKFDIGIFICPDNTLNHKFVLPNKLFEFIQARLCVCVSPNPEMRKIVNDYDCGIVSKNWDPRCIAAKIQSLSVTDINRYKQSSHLASEELCAEKEAIVFAKILRKNQRI